MNGFLLIFIGMLLGFLNSIALQFTIKIFLKIKSIAVIIFSLFLRLFLVCIVFYVFLNKNWKNAVLMLLGLTISKVFFIIYNRLNSIKK